MSGYRCGIVFAKMRMIYVERDQFPEKMISIERMFEHNGISSASVAVTNIWVFISGHFISYCSSSKFCI